MNLQHLPKYSEDLSDFIADLRSKIFASKLEAARYFKLARPTVSRYESGQIRPPFGYLVSLAYLYILALQKDNYPVEIYQSSLLDEINRALRWHYREKEPFQRPFQDWEELSQVASTFIQQRQATTAISANNEPKSRLIDWGEAIEANPFYGRENELSRLEQWLRYDRCRLVALVGLGGVGKTSLSIKISERVKDEFEVLIWRSLRNAPTLKDLLADWLTLLGDQTLIENPDLAISALLDHLRKKRCLLVLDNLETILQEGQPQQAYRSGYQNYSELFVRLGETAHQSCLLLTSREKPGEFELLESKATPVRSLNLTGLEAEAARQILEDKTLFGPPEAFATLSERYSSNPLALKLAAGAIQELFGGDVLAFLGEGQLIFGGISRLLDQQFARLSGLEQNIMYWLAISREFVSLPHLQAALIPAVPKKDFMEALQSLLIRSLIKRSDTGATFSQQPVVMEYLTERIIENFSEELRAGRIDFLSRFPLLDAQGKDYTRTTQLRLLLKPILERLLAAFKSSRELETHFTTLLNRLRTLPPAEQGYAGGNLANLLFQLRGDLQGRDFSNLNIWQAYLQGVNLQNASFACSDLTGSIFTEAFNSICAVSLNSSGQLLAIGCANGEVLLWRMSDGKLLSHFQAHYGPAQTLAFSPTMDWLATGSNDRTIKLWEINPNRRESVRCLQTLEGHEEWVWSVAFSPDGQFLVSGSSDRTIKLWEIPSGNCLQTLEEHQNTIRAVAFSPDGQFLATSGGDMTIRIWQFFGDKLKCVQVLTGHQGWVQALHFSPNSRLLASASEDKTLKIWEINRAPATPGSCLKTLRGHSEWVWSVVFSPDGTQLASSGADRLVKLWDVSSGQCFRTLHGHTGLVRALVFSPNGRILVSGSGDKTARLWEIATGQPFKTLQGYSNPVRAVAFSPDNQKLASTSGNRTVQFWEVNSEIHSPQILPGQRELLWSLAFSPNGKFMATGSEESTVTLWELKSGQFSVLQTFVGHTEWVQSVAFSADSRLIASGSGDRTIKLWNVEGGYYLQTLEGHSEWVWSVVFSPDGRWLASGSSDHTVKIWEVQTGRCLQTLPHHEWVLSVAFSPDGRYLLSSGGEEQSIYVWDCASWQAQTVFTGHPRKVWVIVFHPDGKLFATGSEYGEIKLWEIEADQVICKATLTGHRDWVRALAFSPDGQLLASASEEGTIRLWEAHTGQFLTLLQINRPYEQLNITHTTGLSEVQKASLKALGAFEEDTIPPSF